MHGKIITVAQQKGGAGKTTISAHLAVVLAQKGLKVAVLDTDPQASLTEWHKIREKRFGEGFTGLTFMTISGWRLGSEISRLRKSFDAIVIDSPPHTETEARTAIRYANLIVIPVQPSPTDLWATQATVDIAKGENVPFLVVLNRVMPNTKIAGVIAQSLTNLSETCLGNRVSYASTLMEGMAVTETHPRTTASEEMKMLALEIWKTVAPAEAEESQQATETTNELQDA